MKKALGYTLLELVIVVALVGIVFSIAIPSMRVFTQNDRLVTNINLMVGHLAYARSEAVKRSQQVSVCVSNDSASCTGGDWEDGWIIYIDADGDSAFSGGEEILAGTAEAFVDGEGTRQAQGEERSGAAGSVSQEPS